MAFFGGSTGVIYRQFSITIVSAMVLSVLVALILTPGAVRHAAEARRPGQARRQRAARPVLPLVQRPLRRAARDATSAACGRTIARQAARACGLRRHRRGHGAAVLRLPTGFLPDEDQGAVFTLVSCPSGATLPRTDARCEDGRELFPDEKEKDNVDASSPSAASPSPARARTPGIAFVQLKPWDERQGEENTSRRSPTARPARCRQYRDAHDLRPHPAGRARARQRHRLRPAAGRHRRRRPRRAHGGAQPAARHGGAGQALVGSAPDQPRGPPQLKVDVDQDKAGALGSRHRPRSTRPLSAAWADLRQRFHRPRPGQARLRPGRRALPPAPEDLRDWYVRGADGQMAPFSAFSTLTWANAPVAAVTATTALPALKIQGAAAPGVSSGDGDGGDGARSRASCRRASGSTGPASSYQERQSGGQAPALYALSLLVVFLCLAALYESWTVRSRCCWSSRSASSARCSAPAARARQRHLLPGRPAHDHGPAGEERDPDRRVRRRAHARRRELLEAAVEAARLRLRPILMTPRLHLRRAAAGDRHRRRRGQPERDRHGRSIGGMLTATFLAIFFVPVVLRLREALLPPGQGGSVPGRPVTKCGARPGRVTVG